MRELVSQNQYGSKRPLLLRNIKQDEILQMMCSEFCNQTVFFVRRIFYQTAQDVLYRALSFSASSNWLELVSIWCKPSRLANPTPTSSSTCYFPSFRIAIFQGTMSAQEIPNLLSLRGESRTRGRGRGRGPGLRNPLNQHSESASNRGDKVIQGTDTDAAVSRLSAVTLGYLDDPFARYFVSSSGTRRLPIINRGSLAFVSASAECGPLLHAEAANM
jgi:hypothetical protein